MASRERKKGARVVVADDDEAQREVVKEILASEGYEVVSAESPEEARQLLSSAPDVVMLDLHGIATPEVIESLEALQPRPGLILFSGESRLDSIARDMNVDVGLPKPSDLDELLLAVERALDARDARASAQRTTPPPAASEVHH